MASGPPLPDSLVLEIFLHLPHNAVLSAGLACHQWLAVSRDEFLWRELFYTYYRIPRSVPRHPAAVSWYREFKRLFDCIPCVEVQTLKEHHDQVLHLAFSHRGHRFSSCSKDCTVKIWDTEQPDGSIRLVHSSSMREYNWGYTQFSQFNADDSLLLVSGVYLGPHHTSSGEIAVISLDNYTLLSRVRNKPYDVFGCWLNETHLISGNLHWIGNMTSCSVLWLNKAFQDVESENVNVVKRLFKIQNVNASSIRTVMVAHCRRHDSPDLLLDYEAQLQARENGDRQGHQPLLFDLGSESEEDSDEDSPPGRHKQPPLREPSHMVFQGLRGTERRERQLEAEVARLMGKTHTRPPDPSLLSPSTPEEDDDKTYLLFTTGSLTYSPHQIGIKRIMPDQMTTCGPVLGEERSSEEFFDSLDHVIDIHGHIIGMGLSPDHRYLYVNSRAWPAGCVISDPMMPPPIAEEIDLHVIDLKSLREERRSLRAHRAFTPNDECFFIFLDVSRDFVASGAEDKHGYIWDRHYNICLARLRHEDVVNSVAFSPADQELLLSASDDSTIKVWRSPRMVRLAQGPPRPPRSRKLLSSWLERRSTDMAQLNGKP
ncbi:F-box/WD repeat-containing protein 5 [Paramormyrops kingsleyae]|uniref:F-box and WD repeat domain containing 5 n=1 Tax=Paramormyrops kingsleyae TaxID=1676925 RepID=A0A3B3TE08_9TELE|nr:F-box/WD repeat-containing protein 5 [Paramormyrops kingsleyae]XP_023674418.1 F-box/WD repeat-containing protein 5 [Paramormyrops kingsleyae]